MEVFDYWTEHPPAHISLARIAIGLGIIEAPTTKGSTSPENVAQQIVSGFGGAVFGIGDLPDWMKASMAMAEKTQ
jgi:hypothetical protein